MEKISNEMIKKAQAIQAKIDVKDAEILTLRIELGHIVKASGMSVRKFEEVTGISKSSAQRSKDAYLASLISAEALEAEATKQKHQTSPIERALKAFAKLSDADKKAFLSQVNKGK